MIIFHFNSTTFMRLIVNDLHHCAIFMLFTLVLLLLSYTKVS